MGRSEWGFLIKTKKDLQHIIELVNLHNNWENLDEVGEELELACIFKYKSKLYCCLCSGGGRDMTTEFIETHFEGKQKVYYPFDKPEWWYSFDDQEKIWEHSKTNNEPDPDSIFGDDQNKKDKQVKTQVKKPASGKN